MNPSRSDAPHKQQDTPYAREPSVRGAHVG